MDVSKVPFDFLDCYLGGNLLLALYIITYNKLLLIISDVLKDIGVNSYMFVSIYFAKRFIKLLKLFII